jgi:hypothetical protein
MSGGGCAVRECCARRGVDVSKSWAWGVARVHRRSGHFLGGWGDPAVFINDQRKQNSLSERASSQSGLAHQASR